MQTLYTFVYKDISYPVEVVPKRIRHFYFRWNKKGDGFTITCPFFTTDSEIKKKMIKNLPILIDNKKEYEPPIKGDEIYLFGQLCQINGLSTWTDKEKDKYLKSQLKTYLDEAVPRLKAEMNVKTPYTVKVRTMKTRYGVNNKTQKTLTFATVLVHYSKPIIDSVIYHELAHDFRMDHSDKFYAVLLKYCPDYKILRKKLIKRIYS